MGDPSHYCAELTFTSSELNWGLDPERLSSVEGPLAVLQQRSGSRLRFTLVPTDKGSNVQVDDYQHLARKAFLHRDRFDLQFKVRWYWEEGDSPKGTSGVGFWNDPFMMTGWRMPSLPQAIWLLCHDKRSRLNGSIEASGAGCHGMSLDGWSLPFVCCLPFWLLSLPLWLIPLCRRHFWSLMKRQLCFSDRRLDLDLRSWNHVRVCLKEKRVRFVVNGEEVLNSPYRSSKGLGLVIWMDNQFLIWNDRGWLSMGSHKIVNEQWMEVDEFQLKV